MHWRARGTGWGRAGVRRGLAGRLDRLAVAAKPGGCVWAGGRCVKYGVVGDGSLEPPMPDLSSVCPDCGRPVAWSVVVLPGVDASRL